MSTGFAKIGSAKIFAETSQLSPGRESELMEHHLREGDSEVAKKQEEEVHGSLE